MSRNIELLGYFLGAGFLATLLVALAPITTAIIGRTGFIEVVLLLIVLYIASYLALRGGDIHQRFHRVTRITIIAIFLELILIGGGIFVRLLKLSDVKAFLAPLAVIFIYESFKLGKRLRIKRGKVTVVVTQKPEKIEKEEEAAYKSWRIPDLKEKVPSTEYFPTVKRRKKRAHRTSLVSSLKRRSEFIKKEKD